MNDTYTKKDGIATLYLPNGSHTIRVSVDGYRTGRETINVKDEGRTVTVRLEKGKDEIKVKEISLAGNHSGALTEDGSLYMWGDNYYGQLGNGTTTDSATSIRIHIPADSATVPFALESSERASSFVAAASPSLPQFSPTVTEDSDNPVRKTAGFTNLLPNEIYNFYVLKSREGYHPLDKGNLLCVRQGISDGNGNLSITYEMREEYESPELFVMGRIGIPIS